MLGSGTLVRSLREHDLVDEYAIMFAPLLLGSGKHLFERGPRRDLHLVETRATSTGLILAVYAPAG